jgi:hypothetical protein
MWLTAWSRGAWIIDVLVSQISKDQLPLSSSGGLSDMPEWH